MRMAGKTMHFYLHGPDGTVEADHQIEDGIQARIVWGG